MKRLNRRGVTLTELIVSTILIGIVMIGTVAFNLAVKKVQDSSSKASLLSARISGAINQFRSDAILTVGNITEAGLDEDSTGPERHICFRQEGGDPSTSLDDTWTCYEHDADHAVRRCTNEPTPTDTCSTSTWFDIETGSDFFSIVTDAESRIQYITLTITSLYDNDLAYDEIDNPRVTMTTRASPMGLSR